LKIENLKLKIFCYNIVADMPSNSRDLPAGRQEPKKHSKKFTLEVVRQMITLSTAGFGLVAALAWNSLIQEFVNSYIKKLLPNQAGIISLFLYAVIVTVLAVLITYQLSSIAARLEEKN